MSELQRLTAQLWLGLSQQGSCGPGSLLVQAGGGPDALALGLACLGRGGASLLLAENAAVARASSRAGTSDFIVDRMEEALRILKNELRQRRPVGVALTGDIAAHVEEMVRRGVQPQFAAACGDHASCGWQTLVERGAVPVSVAGLCQQAVVLAGNEGYSLAEHRAATAAERRLEDSRILEADGSSAWSAPLGWMRIAPRLFPRERERVYWQRESKEQ